MSETFPYSVGDKVFIRCVTHHYVGKIKAIYSDMILLSESAWVVDDGRFSHALKTGELNTVEPFPNGCSVGRGTISDISPWNHPIPDVAK